MRFSRTLGLCALGALLACVVVNVATAGTASGTPTVVQNACPIVSASGNQGGGGSTGSYFSSTGTAGGVALGAKGALGSLTIDCDNYSDGLTITAPGHTFSLTGAIKCLEACATCKATSMTTLTCKLSVSDERVGVKAVGSWQATINWLYAADDEAATNVNDGSCHIAVVAALTLGGKPNFTKKDLSVCAYAKGDALQ